METLNHSEKVQDQLTQSLERISFIDKAQEVHARIGALLRAIDNPQVSSEGNLRKRADGTYPEFLSNVELENKAIQFTL